MDWGAWWAAVHGIAKSRTWLSDFTFTFHFDALEKEIATHSSVLAWRIPGTGEPGGLLSMGSHGVGHDWSDLAAAIAAAAFSLVLFPKELVQFAILTLASLRLYLKLIKMLWKIRIRNETYIVIITIWIQWSCYWEFMSNLDCNLEIKCILEDQTNPSIDLLIVLWFMEQEENKAYRIWIDAAKVPHACIFPT